MATDYDIFTYPLSDLRRRTSMKWRTYPDDVLPLWVAEMDSRPIPAVVDAMAAAFALGDTGYPAGPVYEEAWAGFSEHRWGWRPLTSAMRLAPDVLQGIAVVLTAVTSPGDRIVVNPPIYPPFFPAVIDRGCEVVEVPLTADARLDLATLAAVFAGENGPKPTAYLLCSPHNPTGTVHTKEELATVGRLAREHGVTVVCDEIHSPLLQADTQFTPYLSLPESAGDFVVVSAAKGWNLAALKAALILAGPEAVEQLTALPYAATRGGSSHAAVLAHSVALTQAPDFPSRVMVEAAANQRLVTDLLDESITYHPGPATYLAWLDARATGLDDPAAAFLAHGRVALNPGVNFGADYRQFARLNLATSPQILTQAVEQINGVVASHKK